MRLLIATGNAHKITEITDLLSDVPNIELLSLRDFPDVEMPEETGATMRANARLKAEACLRQTGVAALADDSGIEVDALEGAPGVHSARWTEGSDEDRTRALLDRLNATPEQERTARYRCAICIASPEGALIETEATCEGRIGHEFRGSNGFGYDPVFEITPTTRTPPEYLGQTMAEVPPEVKAQVSHRARAIQKTKLWLRTTAL